MRRLAVGAHDRRDLHIPVARITLGGIGRPLEAPDAAGLGNFHARRASALPSPAQNSGHGQPLSGPKSSTSITRLPPSLMNCRRPSRSRILMQSPHPASTLRNTSSLSARPSPAAVNSLRRESGGRPKALKPFRTQYGSHLIGETGFRQDESAQSDQRDGNAATSGIDVIRAKSRARLASPQSRPTSPVNGAGGKTGCLDDAQAPELGSRRLKIF